MTQVQQLNYREVAVRITYKNIRHSYLRINGRGFIELTTGLNTQLEDIERLLAKFYSKLIAKLTAIKTLHNQQAGDYTEGSKIKLLGVNYPLKLIPAANNSVELLNSSCLLRVKDTYDFQLKQQTMHNWYSSYAKQYYSELIQARFPPFASCGFSVPNLRVKAMKTRWGSYSKYHNNINLNLALIKLDAKLIDYVVVHELCHILHQDHSSAFYATMARFLPDWQNLRRELKPWSYILF